MPSQAICSGTVVACRRTSCHTILGVLQSRGLRIFEGCCRCFRRSLVHIFVFFKEGLHTLMRLDPCSSSQSKRKYRYFEIFPKRFWVVFTTRFPQLMVRYRCYNPRIISFEQIRPAPILHEMFHREPSMLRETRRTRIGDPHICVEYEGTWFELAGRRHSTPS